MRTLMRKPKATQQTTAGQSSIHGRPPFQRTIPDLPVQRLLHDTDDLKGDSTPTGLVRSGHDFSRVAVRAKPRTPSQPQRQVTSAGEPQEQHAARIRAHVTPATGPELRRLFSDAASGSPSGIPFRKMMEFSFGEDFSGVKAYLGQRPSMDRLNASAAASGERVVFGASSPDKKLVAHELTHVVQQRRAGTAQLKSQLSSVDEAAEREADSVASRAAAGQRVAVSAAPCSAVQRHIKDKKLDVPLGHFEIDMTAAEVKGGDTGEEGNISFTPNDKAPDSKSIRLSQAVKVFDIDKKADFTFASKVTLNKIRTTSGDGAHTTVKGETLKTISQQHYGEPSRFADIFDANKAVLKTTMATADGDKSLPEKLSLTIPKAVAGGFFIDHLPTDPKAKVRTAKTDPEVPQDYVWPGEEVKNKNQHGSKAGKKIVPAILDDKPKARGTQHLQYDFETAARSEDAGIYYGALHWSFDADGPAGKVTKESHRVAPGVSDTFRAALFEFTKFYKNPHTVMQGETLSTIAEKYYGDPAKSGEILKANKHKIEDPDKLTPGLKLNIPIFGP